MSIVLYKENLLSIKTNDDSSIYKLLILIFIATNPSNSRDKDEKYYI